jgi:type III secretion system FlhB-like substrate exporter
MGAHYRAVALGFTEDAGEEGPPILNARGERLVAETIVAIARRNGIPVVERAEFVEALDDVAVDSSIPRRLFEAAAALLAEVGALASVRGGLNVPKSGRT